MVLPRRGTPDPIPPPPRGDNFETVGTLESFRAPAGRIVSYLVRIGKPRHVNRIATALGLSARSVLSNCYALEAAGLVRLKSGRGWTMSADLEDSIRTRHVVRIRDVNETSG